jgi:two-component system response regulator YesN
MGERTTILLADDEYLVRKGIRHLLRDQAEYSIVADAADGCEAAQKAAELQPQIIILDVKMPRMDGLEALEQIRTSSPESKTIILSGYSSFEYAQRALKLGACDYLLKPVALEELLAVLRRVQRRIQQEARQQESSRRLEECLGYSMSAFIEQFYLQLLHGELPEEELSEKMRVLELENRQVSVLLVGLDHSYRLKTCCTEKAYQEMLQETKAELEGLLREGRPQAPPVLGLSNAVFALLYPDGFHPEPVQFARQVARRIKTSFDHTVSVAVSDRFALREANKAYSQASARLKQRLLLGGDRVLCADPEQAAPRGGYPHELERKLAAAVRFGDEGQVKEVLRCMLRELSGQALPSECWQQIAFDLMEQGYQVARQMNLASVTALEMLEKSREISLLTSWQDIRLWLESSLGLLAERIRTLGAGPSLAVKKALSYIESHFQEKLKLAEVAGYVCLSPNYLTQQIKLQTGKSFREHLCGWRLEEAKRLLGGSVLPVGQIAYQVGYEDPRYFSTVFQRHYGRTPSQYRKACRFVEKPTKS